MLDGGFPAWAGADLPVDASPVADDLDAVAAAVASPPASASYRATLNVRTLGRLTGAAAYVHWTCYKAAAWQLYAGVVSVRCGDMRCCMVAVLDGQCLAQTLTDAPRLAV